MHSYTLHGVALKSVNTSKYLGVHLSSDLKWNDHISKTTATGNRTLGFLKRNLKVRSAALKEKAYFAFLRPKLEYCAAIWDPRKGVERNGAHRIEMVQRRAARWVLSRYQRLDSVSSMLQELKWRTLEQRRVDSRLMLLYKIVHGLVAVDPGDLLRKPLRKTRKTKEHSFLPIRCNTEAFRLSFYPRTISDWNSLSNEIFTRAAGDPKVFRCQLQAIKL